MEGFEFDAPPPYTAADETDDFCNSILTRFSSSTEDQHHRLCAIIGAMSQELKDQKLPLTPIAYFGATCSSLDRLSAEAEPPSHVVEALLTILSTVITHISAAILKKKSEYVSELLVRILRSKSITPGAAVSGLKCVSHLLIIREKVAWSDLSSRYGFVLAYVTDDCPKVRRQSHMCLRDVLLSFQRTSVLAPASEAITNVFERFLLLAGGSNASSSERPKGAQEVLYILDALKDCLPLLSLKFSTSILKYFKSLLELRQPLVTRRITNSLNALCLHPTVELSPEVLLDLLCSLGLSISANEMSVDDMTFTARLLDVGMKKIYSLNRQICIVKLPLIFNALRDILASEHEEALFAATEAFKSVIHACIDGTLIKQGVDQIIASVNVDTRKSRPTIIEKICATIENLLDYRYAMVWDMSFQVVSTMFDKLGVYSPYLLKGTLENLADMQKLPDEDFPYRKQLHECIGSALGAMGPETFLSILPLKLEAEDLSEANVWLFPILKQYTIGARLGFFTKSILAMVGIVKKKSQMLEREGKIYSSRSVDGLVYSLWSLLPSFCNYPLDVAESFKDLEKALSRALREEPDVHGIICSSLQILIRQNKAIVEGKDVLSGIEVSIPRQQAMTRYTPQVAADNLSVLRSSARELLSVLSGIFLKSSNDAGGCLQTTIGEFASISDKAVVTRFFKTTMQKLLKVTQEASKAESSRSSNQMQIDNSSNENSLSLARAQLFDLAVAFLPGLDASEIDLLFIVVKPTLKDVEGFIQKKAYKVLSSILMNSDGFLLRKLEELLNLMIDVLPSCHFSAKRHRLNCLYFLIVHVSKDESEQMRRNIISSFLTEIVLALKEANKKTRNKAYDILVQIGHACGDEEKGGKRENLHQFFNMVAGGLAGETPHMISAAVKGLARLAYEFSDLVSAVYNVLPSAFLLLQRKNNEIAKANLGLLKVLVAKSQAEGLQMHLKGIVEGLLKWQDSTKNLFKAKIKVLLEMLVKKCGLDAVKAVMPEEHMKLLTNIRKIKERKERRVAANSEESKSHLSKATTSRLSRWNHTKIFSDFGDEETDSNPETVSGRRSKASALLTSEASSLRSKRTRKAVKSLPEDLFDQFEDEPLDLLDRQKTRSSLQSSEHLKRKADLDDEPEIDSEGRLVIRLGGKEDEQKREMSPDPESDGRSQAGSHVSMNSQRGQKRRKTSDNGWSYMGSEYASKKARGDVKRKGKLEPYAYWPLDRKMMSRRPEQRAAARKGMASVVKMTKNLEGKSVSSALSLKGSKFKKTKKKVTQKKSRK
ncbi:RRP12-like protein [Camellia lanceoleosa]|uniref:RRP12-like protein n=1 Tax=Camellia lanceoleosa TaxID=1840588 RepID=A0ACC0I710_9ERIC|nr:RRP12-like protein [Camellia lanceoleosa]